VDEAQAIARLKRGDIDALEVLVRRYQVQAIRAAYVVTRDRALAEDIVQSAFLRAYERIDQFDPARPFGPWFLRSVVNDAIKAATRRQCQVPLEVEAEEEATSLTALLADLKPGPSEQVQAGELRQAVWEALGQLPPAQRAAIVLRYYLGPSEAEMARMLSCPPGTVKSRLHSARKRLWMLLQPLWLVVTGGGDSR